MVTISFALICRKNPSITDVDDIQNITKLDLDNSNISVIDNLEIFNHIRELNLSHNKIKSLRNLEYLTSLDVLDLSCNELSSADLLSSIQFLPKQLSTIVLSANPCAEDEIALGYLQELFPSLGIAIDEVDENDMESDNAQNDPNDEDNSTNENEVLPSADTDPVNVEEVLKYIVDRKCKLQSLQSFDLDSIVKELSEEADKAMESSRSKRSQLRKVQTDLVPQKLEAFEEKYKQSIENMKLRNEVDKTSYEEIIQRLRSSAQHHLDSLKTNSLQRSVDQETKG
jgi:hypothetical protein